MREKAEEKLLRAIHTNAPVEVTPEEAKALRDYLLALIGSLQMLRGLDPRSLD